MDWMDEVRRVLQWLEADEAFRAFYFRDPEAALAALEAAGEPLSDFARRTWWSGSRPILSPRNTNVLWAWG